MKPSLQFGETLSWNVVEPEKLGIDGEVLKEYERAMRQYVKSGLIPGFASVVLKGEQVVHSMSHGYADMEAKRPYTMKTLCRLICMTKSYIAVAFMTLVEEGHCSLEDRLDKWLPEFSAMQVMKNGKGKPAPARNPILLKHLMSHTSGMGYPSDEAADDKVGLAYKQLQKSAQRGTIRSLQDFVDRLSKVPLLHHPGTMYEYGFSVDVLGRVLEVIMGMDVEQCLKEKVFEPLNMRDTVWAVPDRSLDRLAACYAAPKTWRSIYGQSKQAPVFSKKGLWRVDGAKPQESNWRRGRQCRVKSGGGFMGYIHGGLVSTVEDTVRFVRMLLKRGIGHTGKRLVTEKSLALMERNRLQASWKQGSACYLGNIGVFRDKGPEFGMGGAACTYWSVDRADDIATVWFSQHYDMPDFGDVKSINPKRADLWKAMYDALRTKAARKYQASIRTAIARKNAGRAATGKKTKFVLLGKRKAAETGSSKNSAKRAKIVK